VTGLQAESAPARVIGVGSAAAVGSQPLEETLPANLVVDYSGRISRRRSGSKHWDTQRLKKRLSTPTWGMRPAGSVRLPVSVGIGRS
jgi:hypothetical protein